MMKFTRFPSEKIFKGLENGDWDGEEKETALSVLKMRGKDLSRLDKEPELKPVKRGKLDILTGKVDRLLRSNEPAQRNAVKSLMEGVKNIHCLPEETVDYLNEEMDALLGKKRAKAIALKSRGRRNYKKRRKSSIYISPEHKKIIANIGRRKLTKGQKIMAMIDAGISREEIESLAIATCNYIYLVLKRNGRI